MSNLVDLTTQYSYLICKLAESGGEVTPEVESHLISLEQDIIKKADSIVYIKERLEHDAEYWRSKSRSYSKIAITLENAADRLKNRLKYAMQSRGISDLIDGTSRFKLVDMAPKLIVEDESLIPNLYMKQTVVIEPDFDMIKAALKQGASVPGCKLEPVQAIRVYPQKEL